MWTRLRNLIYPIYVTYSRRYFHVNSYSFTTINDSRTISSFTVIKSCELFDARMYRTYTYIYIYISQEDRRSQRNSIQSKEEKENLSLTRHRNTWASGRRPILSEIRIPIRISVGDILLASPLRRKTESSSRSLPSSALVPFLEFDSHSVSLSTTTPSRTAISLTASSAKIVSIRIQMRPRSHHATRHIPP